MLSLDDLLDIVSDALTREPDAPVAQPLFECSPASERRTQQVYGPNDAAPLLGVSQDFFVPEWGRFRITVEEVGEWTECFCPPEIEGVTDAHFSWCPLHPDDARETGEERDRRLHEKHLEGFRG